MSVTEFMKTMKRKRAMDKQFQDAVDKTFVPGTRVKWTHGRHKHYGEVIRSHGFRQCVFVRNDKTGKEYRLDVHRVVWHLLFPEASHD